MGDLLVRIIPLAVGAAASPTMLAVLVVVLARPPRALRRGVAFTVCGTLPLLAVGAAVALVWRSASLGAETAAPKDGAEAWVDVAAGVALLLLGAALLVRHRRRGARAGRASAGPQAGTGQAADQGSVLHAGLLGLGLMASNTSTLVLYVPAAKDIANADEGALVKLAGWLVLLVVTMLPMLAALVAYAVAPATAQRVLQPLGAWFDRHSFAMTLTIFVLLGLFLVARGGYHLVAG